MNKAYKNSTRTFTNTDPETGKQNTSWGPLLYNKGMNKDCLFSKEITNKNGVKNRVEVWRYYSGNLVWAAYRLNVKPSGFIFWEKVPSFTRAEENAFPKELAKIAHYFCQKCKDRINGKDEDQLTLAI